MVNPKEKHTPVARGTATLLQQLPVVHAASRLQLCLLTLMGSLVVVAAAQIHIPLAPVPMTMQTVAIMVIGLVCPPRIAGAAVSAYVLEGCIGLPVFAGFSGGARILLGPTSGYILGFV